MEVERETMPPVSLNVTDEKRIGGLIGGMSPNLYNVKRVVHK
ncbi:MAG: hypothetical protein QXH44_09915 [Pyrobaculum sp.]